MTNLSPITQLPLELISMIVRDRCLGAKDLIVLCTFKLFYTPASELLYERFYGHSGNILHFLETVFTNKWLASRVQFIHLQDLCAPREMPMSHSILEHFTPYIESLSLPDYLRKPWISHLESGHGEALAALLLVYLPNVKELEIWTDDRNMHEHKEISHFLIQKSPFWTLPLSKQFSNSYLQFRNLEKLDILSLPCSVHDLARLFALPTIKSLQVWDVIESRQHRPLPEASFMPDSSHISRLSFSFATISIECLRKMLSSCKSLEEFTYNCPTDTQITKDYNSLITALSKFRDSLKVLRLVDQSPYLQEPSTIRSLATFTKLEFLASDATVLLDKTTKPLSNVLPHGIVHIVLHETVKQMLINLGGGSGILKDLTRARRFPCLRRVTIVRSMYSLASNENFLLESFSDGRIEVRVMGGFVSR